MENDHKKVKVDDLTPRKNELRSLFKKCFKNPLFSLVPFEINIWRDLIVSNTELKTITIISQTCYAFKKIVDMIGENNFNLALMFRRECQIDLAKKFLSLCAETNNPLAMLHLGYAYRYRGWGLEKNLFRSAEWLRKSAELGNAHAMAFYSFFLKREYKDVELSNGWAKKALTSKNSFAIGYCHYLGLGTPRDADKEFLFFEASAKEGDEFAQYFLGGCYRRGSGTERSLEAAFHWYLKAAEKGLASSIFRTAEIYCEGEVCEKNDEMAIMWFKKAAKQGHERSIDALN